jgi:TP901 family phage tail tape measure protein
MQGSEVGSAFAKLGLDDKELDSGMNSAKGKFGGFCGDLEGKAKSSGAAIGKALAAGAVAATVALAGVATVGVKTYMDVESAAADAASKMDLGPMAQKSGITIEKAFDNVKQHVMSLSDELGQLNTNAFDPTTIAQACADLASGGFDVATASAKDLSPMLALATATNYDLGSSCSMVTDAMSMYGKGVKDIGNISDVYARACADSKLGMEELNYSMKLAGPAAAGYGVSLETTTALLENFAEVGIKGEMAGASVRDVINSLGAPTDKVAKGLAAMGLSAKDVDPRFHDVNESLKKMYDASVKSGAGAQAFSDVFGINGALIFGLAKSSAKTDEFRNKLLDCNGAAESMAKMMLDNLKGSLDAAMGAASSLAYMIGGYLAPSLKACLDWFSATGAPAIRAFIDAIANGKWGDVGQMISNGLKSGWDVAIGFGKQIYDKLRGLPWGGLWTYIVGGIKTAWGGLSNLGSQLLGYVKNVNWAEIGTNLANAVSGAVVNIGTTIYNGFKNVDWSGIVSLIIGYFSGMVAFYSTLGKNLYDAIIKVDWKGIGQTILTSLENIPTQIQTLFSKIDFGKMWDTLTTSVSGAATSIYNTLNNIQWGDLGYKGGKMLADAVGNAISTLSNIGTKITDYLKTASASASSIGSDIGTKIKAGLATVQGWMDQAKTGFLIGWEDTGKKIGEFIKTAIASITDYGTAIANTIYTNLKTWVDNNLGNLSQIGKDIGADFVKGIVAWIMADAKIWASLWNLLTNAPKWLAIGVEAIGTLIQGMVQGGLDTLADLFSVAILTGAKAAVDLINPVLAKIGQHIDTTEIDTKLASLKTALTSLGDTHVDAKVGVATTYTGGSDPSTLEGKNYDATLTVKTYLNPAGENIQAPVISQAGTRVGFVPNSSNMEIGTKSFSDVAKGMAGQGADANQIRDALINAIKEENDIRKDQNLTTIDLTNGVVTKAISDAIGAAQPQIEAYAFTHKTVDEASTQATKENIALEKEAINDITLKFKEGVGGAATGFFDTVVAGAKAASAPIVDAGLTFRQQIWKAVSDTDQTWRSTNQAVCIGLDSQGRKVAVIGQVAQAQFQAAGGKWVSDSSYAGVTFGAKIGSVGDSLVSKVGAAGSQLSTTISLIGNTFATAVANAAASMNNAASNITNVVLNFKTGTSNAANTGFFNSSTSTASSNSATSSGVSHSPTSATSGKSSVAKPTFPPESGLSGWAEGTKTTGPQFAMIGEDGPAHPEYVIPTKTKRWDLLYAAMRAYGIPGYAEGTATGTAGAAEGDAPPLSATFGISGLASMSKGVQKIINDLKDFFRISWGIIKSEASTYWKSIEKVITDEVTIVRDAAWQGALDIRNTWISSDAAILADATASYAALWPAISPSIASVHDGIISSFTDSESQVKSIMDQMASDAMTSLSSFQVSWTTVWQQLLADLSSTSSQISSMLSQIAAEVGAISVNVNVGGSGGYSNGGSGSGGGSSPDEGDMGSGSTGNGGLIMNPDGSANYITKDCFGRDVLVNALKYTAPDGKVSYFNPMNGGFGAGQNGASAPSSSGGSGGSYGGFTPTTGSNPWAGSSAPVYGNSGVSVPGGSISSFFSADGGVFDKPAVTHVAEKGIEMVLPTKLTRMFMALADSGVGNGPASKIVIEDHTVNEHYWDGRKVADLVMTTSKKKIQLRGGVPHV